MTMQIGCPVVLPSNTPESISNLSSSFLCVVTLLCPGFLLSSSFWIKISSILMPGLTPSITQPTALPWLSPNVVTRKYFPNVDDIKHTSINVIVFLSCLLSLAQSTLKYLSLYLQLSHIISCAYLILPLSH